MYFSLSEREGKMARCRDCRAYNVKISETSSRRSFVYQCVNPRCRHTYVITLGIAGDLVPVLGAMQRRRSFARDQEDTGAHMPQGDSVE